MDNASHRSGESFDSQFSDGFTPEQKAEENKAKALKKDFLALKQGDLIWDRMRSAFKILSVTRAKESKYITHYYITE